MRLHAGWCTRDWCGGANYGRYTLREALRIAKRTKGFDVWDRQAVTFVVMLEARDRRAHTEWTVDFHPRLRVRRYRMNIRDDLRKLRESVR